MRARLGTCPGTEERAHGEGRDRGAGRDGDSRRARARGERRIAGVCAYCAGAFGVKEAVVAQGVQLVGEYEGHPSVRRLVHDGYQVITF
jgi:hypothetical protein